MTDSRRASDQGTHRHTGPVARILGLVLVIFLLCLGLIGLVFPLLPGLLFLLLAIYVLSRVSRRFAFLAHRNSWLRRTFRRLGHVRSLPPLDLLRLGFWVTLRGAVNALATAGDWFRRSAGKTGGNHGQRP